MKLKNLVVYERTNNGQACENAADPKAQKMLQKWKIEIKLDRWYSGHAQLKITLRNVKEFKGLA